MKISSIAALSFAALIGGTTLSMAQVPNPADPAPANPTATNGAPTEAPAKAGDKMGTGDKMSSGKMMTKKKPKKKMMAHVSHKRMMHHTSGKATTRQ